MWSFVRGARFVGSELLLTEVPRALRGDPEEDPAFDLVLWRAGRTFDPGLRSLEAIHVMTALELRPIEAFVPTT